MQELRYERPATIADAVALAGRDGARMLAGGTDLIPQVREGRRPASLLVDIKHVTGMTNLERVAGGWRIGAGASVARLGADPDFAREHAALLASARLIGSLQVQSRATLAGNLCNAAPSADAVPLLIALGAEAEIAGPGATRRVPAAVVPVAPGRTSLAAGEILVAIHLPPMPSRRAASYLRFTPRREMDIAIAGSGVRIDLGAVSCCVRAVRLGPVGVSGGKGRGDVVDHRLGVARVEPHVRVAGGLIIAPRPEGDAGRHDRACGISTGVADHAVEPGVEVDPVLQHDRRAGHRLDIARRRFEVVGVAVRGDHLGEADPVATDVPREVGDLGGRRDDAERAVVGGTARSTCGEGGERGAEKRGEGDGT